MGEFINRLDGDRLLALVTHPGRVEGRGESVFVLHGAQAASGTKLSAAPADVVPTLLHALGLPISRELAGQPATELFWQTSARSTRSGPSIRSDDEWLSAWNTASRRWMRR
jgi:hypothetical protein